MIRNSNQLAPQSLYYNVNSAERVTTSYGQTNIAPPPKVTFGQPNTRTSTLAPFQEYTTLAPTQEYSRTINQTIPERTVSYGQDRPGSFGQGSRILGSSRVIFDEPEIYKRRQTNYVYQETTAAPPPPLQSPTTHEPMVETVRGRSWDRQSIKSSKARAAPPASNPRPEKNSCPWWAWLLLGLLAFAGLICAIIFGSKFSSEKPGTQVANVPPSTIDINPTTDSTAVQSSTVQPSTQTASTSATSTSVTSTTSAASTPATTTTTTTTKSSTTPSHFLSLRQHH